VGGLGRPGPCPGRHDPVVRAADGEVGAPERLAEGVEVEERVAGEHLLAVGQEPAVDLALLVGGRVQLLPRVDAPARGT